MPTICHPLHLPQASQIREAALRSESSKGASSSSDGNTGGRTSGDSPVSDFPLSRGAWPALEFIKMEGELLPTEPEAFDCESGGGGCARAVG